MLQWLSRWQSIILTPDEKEGLYNFEDVYVCACICLQLYSSRMEEWNLLRVFLKFVGFVIEIIRCYVAGNLCYHSRFSFYSFCAGFWGTIAARNLEFAIKLVSTIFVTIQVTKVWWRPARENLLLLDPNLQSEILWKQFKLKH